VELCLQRFLDIRLPSVDKESFTFYLYFYAFLCAWKPNNIIQAYLGGATAGHGILLVMSLKAVWYYLF